MHIEYVQNVEYISDFSIQKLSCREFRYFSSVDNPGGIYTDRISRILVCRNSRDILVLDENDLFYTKLEESQGIIRTIFENMQYMFSKTIGPVRSQEKIKGLSLSYDDNTDLIWVGLNDSNTIFGYRIVHRKRLSNLHFLQMPRLINISTHSLKNNYQLVDLIGSM